jgi:hypothetical protein
MNDLPMLAREENVRIASSVWPVFTEMNRAAAVDLVRRVLRGEPCRVTPGEASQVRALAALAVSRAHPSKRVRNVEGVTP